jgi:hypothetical protein
MKPTFKSAYTVLLMFSFQLASTLTFISQIPNNSRCSLIGISTSVGFIKEHKTMYGTEYGFDRLLTSFHSIHFVRPQKPFFGSFELYLHSYQCDLHHYETYNENYSNHGTFRSYNFKSFSYKANVQRLGLLTNLNIRLTGNSPGIQIFGLLGLGIEQTLKYSVIKDYYNEGSYSSGNFYNYNTEQLESFENISSRPMKASEKFNLKPGGRSGVFAPAIKIQKQITPLFEIALQLGTHLYLAPFPGRTPSNYMVKTSAVSLQLFYRLSKPSLDQLP